MNKIDTSLNIADYYFHMLNTLSRKGKLYLVKKLTDSLLNDEAISISSYEEEKKKIFNELAGAWANDPEADVMEKEIRNARTSNTTRKIITFEE